MFSQADKRHATLYIFALAIFSIMGLSIIGPALPDIAKDFEIPVDAAWGLFTAFAVPGALVVLLVGIAADRYGRVPIIIVSLITFILGSVGCALALSFESLLFWRAIQGLGSGPLITLNNILVADVFAPHERPRMIGLTAVALTLSSAMFPLLGGLLAEVDWRYTFWLSLLALPLLVYSCKIKLPYQGTSVGFVEYGKLCLRIVSSKEALTLFFINFVMFFIFYGPIATYFPILLEYFFTPGSTLIGMVFLAGSLLGIFSALMAGRVANAFSMRSIVCLGFITNAVAIGLVFVLGQAWLFFIPLVLCTTAQNLMMPVLASRVSMLSDAEGRGAAMATNSLMFRVAQAISPAVCALMWATIDPYGPFIMGCVGAVFLACFAFVVFPAGVKVTDNIPVKQ